MANVCTNDEYIYGPKEQMNELYDLFDELFTSDKDVDKMNQGVHSISFFIEKLGLEDLNLYSRCEILEYLKDYDEGENLYFLSFESYSAWNPMYETWDKILSKKFPDCKYAFWSIEPGFEIYEIRDPYDKFNVLDYNVNIEIHTDDVPDLIAKLVELYGDDIIEDSWTERQVRDFIKELCSIDKDIPTEDLLKEINKWNNDLKSGIYISIHPYVWIE